MNYLSLRDIVLKSEYKILIFNHGDALSVKLNSDYKSLTITITDDTKISDLSDYIISKSELDEILSIDDGEYLLHSSIKINGFEYALSDSSVGCDFSQLVFNHEELNEIRIERKGNMIRSLVWNDTDVDDYISKVNESLYYFILSTDNPEFNTITGVQTYRANKIDVRSKNKDIKSNDGLIIETADYISALIMTLIHDYPDVQFFANDQEMDDSKYKEFCKYIANPESYDNSITTAHVFSDPIYGDVLRTNCYIAFEYFTNDLSRFNKKKYDYMINRFISDHGVAYLPFPGTDRGHLFNVTWDRNEPANDQEVNKNTSKIEGSRGQYSFTFFAKLTVTIYRLRGKYSELKKLVLGQIHYLPPNTTEGPKTVNDASRDGRILYKSLNGRTYYK